MARVTIEDCLERINNHFTLVLVAGHRAQQLQSGVAPKIEAGNDKPTIIALREIAEGLVDESILDEPLMQDTTAEDELADLIAHGLMNQEIATELGEITDEPDEDEESAEPDTLETGTETIEQMEKIANLNLDHLKASDDTPSETDSALASELSESEIAMGEKLLGEAGAMVGGFNAETGDKPAADTPAANEAAADTPAAGTPAADEAAGDQPEEGEPAAEKPA